MISNKEEAPKKVEQTYTPAEYGARFCTVKARRRGDRPSQSVGFTVADILYDWKSQAHHFGADSFRLTAAQFEQAIEAAMAHPNGAPFEPAFPPVSLDKLKKIKAR